MFRQIDVGGIRRGGFHTLGAGFRVAQDHGHASRVLRIADARPANTVGMIQIIILFTVGVTATGEQKLVDQPLVAARSGISLTRVPSKIVLRS